MARLTLQFFSKALNVNTSVGVILPDPGAFAKPPKVLYLLHGYGDDQTTWMRNTSVERYASLYNLCVVMPGVNHSFYTDEKYGEKYWTFVSEELPEMLHGYFRLSRRVEDTFVAGQSMGGYGTMKLALTHPDRFAAAGCFSGAVDIHDDMARNVGDLAVNSMHIYGGEEIPADCDLYQLMKKPSPARPKLYVACGDKDFLYNQHLTFVPALKESGWDVTHRTDPGMTHSWGYWDIVIRDFLDWAMSL